MRKRMIRIREVENGFIVDCSSQNDHISNDDCVFQSMAELLEFIYGAFEFRCTADLSNDLKK